MFGSPLFGLAKAAQFNITRFIGTDGHIGQRQIGDGSKRISQFGIGAALNLFSLLQGVFQSGDFIHQTLGFGLIALPFGLADFLGGFIALGL